MIILGIDPGYHTGIAVVDWSGRRPKALILRTVRGKPRDVQKAIVEAIDIQPDTSMAAVVQTPFNKRGKTPRWNASPVSLAKHAYLVGRIVQFLMSACVDVQEIPAPQGRRTGMKMDTDYFNRLFQWDDSSSEHSRDAANLTRQWKPELVEANR